MRYGLLRVPVLMLLLFAGGTAFAQDDAEVGQAEQVEPAASEGQVEVADETESEAAEDETALFEGVREQSAPDGTNDYAEIHQMRVLERTFLSAEEHQTSGSVGTLLPADYMELSPTAPLHLNSDAQGTNPRGLQRQASKWMAEAVALVRKQITESAGSLDMPFGLDCAQEPAVQEYVAVFSSAASGTMKTWLKRLERWRPVLEKVLIEENVPTDLLYLAMIESGFKTRVRSPASAAGMWQFMAGTGVEMGLKIDAWVDERYDPIKAAHAAAKYLKKQYARYNSWPLAMAAYNGGPGTVNVAIDRYNTTDYFKLVEYGAMYEETRRYVPRILAVALIGHNPAAFGFDGLKPDPPFVFDTVSVPGDTRLQVLAEAAGCSLNDLKDLNPELLKDVTPPGGSYELRIPLNHHQAFVNKFDQVSKKYANASDVITLRFGETVEILGNEIGVPARVLRNLNGLSAKQPAAYGSELIVPDGSRRGAGSSDKKSKKDDEDDRPIALISPETFEFRNKQRIFYETQAGDSIREIADAFGVLPNQIAIWNELDVWARLRPKMILQIYVGDMPDEARVRYYREEDMRVIVRGSEEHLAMIEAKRNASSRTARTAAKHDKSSSGKAASSKSSSKSKYLMHTVKKGESLSKIAQKYNISLESLLKLNGLTKDSAIRKGQQLKIKKQ